MSERKNFFKNPERVRAMFDNFIKQRTPDQLNKVRSYLERKKIAVLYDPSHDSLVEMESRFALLKAMVGMVIIHSNALNAHKERRNRKNEQG